jgi:hypothetical protein
MIQKRMMEVGLWRMWRLVMCPAAFSVVSRDFGLWGVERFVERSRLEAWNDGRFEENFLLYNSDDGIY